MPKSEIKRIACPHCGESTRPTRHCEGRCTWVKCTECSAIVDVGRKNHLCPNKKCKERR